MFLVPLNVCLVSLLSDDPIDPELLSTNPIADYQRAEEMRVAATRAWAALDSRRRLKRSLSLVTALLTISPKANLFLFGDNLE